MTLTTTAFSLGLSSLKPSTSILLSSDVPIIYLLIDNNSNTW